jgi:hypothetical protein
MADTGTHADMQTHVRMNAWQARSILTCMNRKQVSTFAIGCDVRIGWSYQMIVPHRVVQAQAAIALTPRVARALVFLHDNRGHVELLEAGAQSYPALPAADDQHVSGCNPRECNT